MPNTWAADEEVPPDWVTVTSLGLPTAPAAVTCIVPVLADVPVFAEKAQAIVPVLVPLAPDDIDSQLLPDVTEAVQLMVPVPVLETPNVVVPASLATLRPDGMTESTGSSSSGIMKLNVPWVLTVYFPAVSGVNVTVR
jgi:hypothetical protein